MNLLFITKRNGSTYNQSEKSGVHLSAEFIANGLKLLYGKEINVFVFDAIDNNCIDRYVTETNADIVVIEAYWVVPEKFVELSLLHPNVKWVIRNHSALPFMAEDGIIIDWSIRYLMIDNVYLASNHKTTYEDMKLLSHYCELSTDKILYLPNYYPIEKIKKRRQPRFKIDGEVHIGCFGANRSLKNQLVQAYSALRFSRDMGRKLYFHINGELGSNNPILKNLVSIFESASDAELVIHPWMNHQDFYNLCGKMDIGMQLSFTETFNIVVADMVANDIPVVVSDEISWVSKINKTNPLNVSKIIKTLKLVSSIKNYIPCILNNQNKLRKYSRKALIEWNLAIRKLIK